MTRDDRARDDRCHRRAGRCRQEHGRPARSPSGSASATSTPARCTGRSRGSRSSAALDLSARGGARRARRASTRYFERREPRLDRRRRRHRRDPARRGSTGSCRSSRAIQPFARSCASASASSARDGNVVIEGRDIGTVVAPAAEVKVYLVADRRCARSAGCGAARDRRRRPRHRPEDARRERRGAHAPRGGRGADRHDEPPASTTSSSRSRGSSAPSAAGVSRRQDERSGRSDALRWGAPRGWRPALRAYGRERVPREGGLVLAINHSALDRHPGPRRALAAEHRLRREGRGAQLPGLRRSSSARSGRSRSAAGSPTATPCGRCAQVAPTGARSALFVEGTRQRTGVPGRRSRARRWSRSRRTCRSSRAAIYGTQFWKLGNFAPCSIAFGAADALRAACRGTAEGYKEATAEIESEIHRLFDWLAEVHADGRPKGLTPP